MNFTASQLLSIQIENRRAIICFNLTPNMKCWRTQNEFKNFMKESHCIKQGVEGSSSFKDPHRGPRVRARGRALLMQVTWPMEAKTVHSKTFTNIKEGKYQIHTLFVFLYKRGGWCDGSSAHTCKNINSSVKGIVVATLQDCDTTPALQIKKARNICYCIPPANI